MTEEMPTRVCTKCHQEKPVVEFRMTSAGGRRYRRSHCNTCLNAWRREYRQRPERRAQRPEEKQKTNAQLRRLRMEVVAAYGGVCECCGETEARLLNVDHVDNDGARERREQNMFSQKLHYFLRRNGYPRDRYQLLCVNCNMGKAKYGRCPHALSGPNIVRMALAVGSQFVREAEPSDGPR